MVTFVCDSEHFSKILTQTIKVKHTLWVGTADIKDLYISNGKVEKPFLGVLSELIGKGVNVRLIHAKEPGPAFREDFDKYKNLVTGLEHALCPRVHFKIIVIDCKTAYIGSANLTGAVMGMKSPNRRNFETGILTDKPELVEAAMEEFDKVWRGEMCKKRQRKQYCGDPIVR
ncbi:MAG: phospholipase D family protein [Paludibacteraceae bacterium]|nr:phospholipase D family protein [Paludibacteraceae bacterium]